MYNAYNINFVYFVNGELMSKKDECDDNINFSENRHNFLNKKLLDIIILNFRIIKCNFSCNLYKNTHIHFEFYWNPWTTM